MEFPLYISSSPAETSWNAHKACVSSYYIEEGYEFLLCSVYL